MFFYGEVMQNIQCSSLYILHGLGFAVVLLVYTPCFVQCESYTGCFFRIAVCCRVIFLYSMLIQDSRLQ
jgi:hypothetical protein